MHSAILEVDDPKTEGIDKQILTTVVVSKDAGEAGVHLLGVRLGAAQQHQVVLRDRARGRQDPRGRARRPGGRAARPGSSPSTRTASPVEDSSTTVLLPELRQPGQHLPPGPALVRRPEPGVWEIEVESRRTSPLLDNPYKLDVSRARRGLRPGGQDARPRRRSAPRPPVEWKVTNGFAAIDGKLAGGSLGSAKVARPTIANGETQEPTVTIGEGVERLDVAIGGVSDTGADLDLTSYWTASQVGQSADGDSEEAVSLLNPAAGTYTVEVDGYAVPAGTTDVRLPRRVLLGRRSARSRSTSRSR